MTTIRLKTPKRRDISNEVTHYSDHKPDLRIDFEGYCGYCGAYDRFRHAHYEVDHFIPKNFFLPLGNIKLTQYSNLVYCCKPCNGIKNNKWPSKSETVFHDGKEGFVDPCTDEYDDHLYRTESGAIMWKTDLGKWMHTVAFRFDERERQIQFAFQMNKIRLGIEELELEQAKHDSTSENFRLINDKILTFTGVFYKFHKQLMEFN